MVTDKKNEFRDLVKGALQRTGFYVSDLNFEHIITDGDFRKRIIEDFAESDVAKILLFSPDLFAMHGKIDPDKGCFFITCCPDIQALSNDKIEIYKKYYPVNSILVVYCNPEKRSEICAKWFSEFPIKANVSFLKCLKNITGDSN